MILYSCPFSVLGKSYHLAFSHSLSRAKQPQELFFTLTMQTYQHYISCHGKVMLVQQYTNSALCVVLQLVNEDKFAYNVGSLLYWNI